MAPTFEAAEKRYSDQLNFVHFMGRSTDKAMELTRLFGAKVEMRYAPTFIVATKDNRILSYAKGAIPEAAFNDMIETGIQKSKKLAHMKLDKIILLCNMDGPTCKSWETPITNWLASHKEKKITLDKIDLSSIKSEEEAQSFRKKLYELKYLTELEFAPALIATNDQGEVIEQMQSTLFRVPVTAKRLENELKPFF
jgi:hypothetical protein